MAGFSSADPKRVSPASSPKRAVAPNAARSSLGEVVRGPARYIAVASALHAVALVIASITPGQSHISVLISIGLGLCLVSLWLTYRTAGAAADLSEVSETAFGKTDESKATGALSLAPGASHDHAGSLFGSSSMSPLPFMGERIVLRPHGGLHSGASDAANIARLATAARRVSQMTSQHRRHPWSELMARVSHELRTPLNAVIGFSDVMSSELLGPVGHPRYQEYAQHIRDCGRELLKSAEDTLAITYLLDAEVQGHQAQIIELHALAADAWSFHLEKAHGRNIELRLEVSSDMKVAGDRRALRQVLINLMAEAFRHSADGGTIGISAVEDCDLVQVEIFVRSMPGTEHIAEASLAICLARALLELQGANLVELDDPGSTWRALTVLRAVAQHDLFQTPQALDAHRANVA